MELNICHLYPDILNLYGDRGNILCMQKRLEWRGIGVTVTGVSIGQALEASAYDLLFVGGGQDFEQTVLLADLRAGRAENIRAAAEDGKTGVGLRRWMKEGGCRVNGEMCFQSGIGLYG